MPSPKPVRTAAAAFPTNPSASAASSAAILRQGSPDAAAGLELDNVGGSSSSGASGRPRRRSSLLKNHGGSNGSSAGGGRPRKASTAASTAMAIGTTTAASRLQPRDDADGDGWDDAWGEDDENENAARHNDDRTLLEEDYEGGGGNVRGSGGGGGNGDLHSDEETGLSPAARRQRAEARRQRTHLDQRFVPGDYGDEGGSGFGFGDGRLALNDPQSVQIMAALTEDERKEADKHVVRRLVTNGSLIGLWYLFSLSISVYNKWMFGSNFPFPLFTTSIHMLVQFFLACLVLYFIPSLRPGRGVKKGGSGGGGGDGSEDDFKMDQHSSTGLDDRSNNPLMTKWFYLTRIGPCGAATGLDIGLGNASLKLITLTFYTMCKSSSLAFVLLFAFAFRLETPTVRLVAIIATMTVGVVMMVAGEVEFDTFGFVLVITAAFFSGFRWGLTQIMLLRNPATNNPFSSIFYLAPVMFVTLFLLAIPMEGFPELIEGFRVLSGNFGPVRTPLLVLFPGTIAFLMTASEFALLQRTSVVTLSIAGIFKEVVTIATSTLVFHDTLTLVNLLGLVVTMAAIVVYNYIKITKMRQQAQIDVLKEHHRGHSDNHPLQPLQQRTTTGPTEYAVGLASSSSSSASNTPPPPPPPADHADHDSDADGENDAEDTGLLRRP